MVPIHYICYQSIPVTTCPALADTMICPFVSQSNICLIFAATTVFYPIICRALETSTVFCPRLRRYSSMVFRNSFCHRTTISTFNVQQRCKAFWPQLFLATESEGVKWWQLPFAKEYLGQWLSQLFRVWTGVFFHIKCRYNIYCWCRWRVLMIMTVFCIIRCYVTKNPIISFCDHDCFLPQRL